MASSPLRSNARARRSNVDNSTWSPMVVADGNDDSQRHRPVSTIAEKNHPSEYVSLARVDAITPNA